MLTVTRLILSTLAALQVSTTIAQIMPSAVWTMVSDSKTVNYNNEHVLLSVGSGVIFSDDCPPGAPTSCRSLEFRRYHNSHAFLYRPDLLNVENGLSVIMYINTDGVSYTSTSTDDNQERIILDFTPYPKCQSGLQMCGLNEVTGAMFFEHQGDNMKARYGDDRGCTTRTESTSKSSDPGWIRIGFSIEWKEVKHKCDFGILKSDGTSWSETRLDHYCLPLPDLVSGPIVIGELSTTCSGTSTPFVNNFIGKIACIQVYNTSLKDGDTWADACDGPMDQEAFPTYEYFYFGVEPIAEETTTPQLAEETTAPQQTTSDTPTTTEDLTTEGETTIWTTAAETTATSYKVPPGHCPCMCSDSLTNARQNYSQEELSGIVNGIRKELLVDKQSTSSEKRKKTSATDERTSSQFVGTLGVGLCTAVMVLILSADAITFFRSLASFFKRG